MAVTDTPTTTLGMIGEHLREARQEVHDLKTFVMGMEDMTDELALTIHASQLALEWEIDPEAAIDRFL